MWVASSDAMTSKMFRLHRPDHVAARERARCTAYLAHERVHRTGCRPVVALLERQSGEVVGVFVPHAVRLTEKRRYRAAANDRLLKGPVVWIGVECKFLQVLCGHNYSIPYAPA